MKIFKEHPNGVVLCLFELIVGILLLINPIGFTSGIITVAGIVLMIVGAVSVVKYFRASAPLAAVNQELTKGLLFLLGGAFCAFRTEWFLVTFPLLTILYGVELLVNGVSKIQLTVDMLRLKAAKWFWAAISAVVSLVCAAVILGNPFVSTEALWMFTGIALIVEAVFNIITMIFNRKGTAE